MYSSKGLNCKKTYIWIMVGVLLGMTLILQACSNLDPMEASPAWPTWTPVAHPTDQPYQAEKVTPPYFGDTPFVAILGSHDPENDTSLQAINLSTDDVYDVSSLTPGPISTWSRPIMSTDKELFFQIGSKLYKLLPGGAMTSVDLLFNEEDPVFCNWSWRGQVVCLNGLMTEGYLVDQDLNVIEMPLPAYRPTDHSIEFYAPYRVGENMMRIIETKTRKVGKKFAIHYRELDLESMTISNDQIGIRPSFYRAIGISSQNSGTGRNIFTQSDENLDVLGLTEDGQKALFMSLMEQTDKLGNRISEIFWVDIYDVQEETLSKIDTEFNKVTSGNQHYRNQLVTALVSNGEILPPSLPGVYDLATGEMLFYSSDAYDTNDMDTAILPYGENWLVECYFGIGFVNENGFFMATYYFPDEIIEAYGDLGLYVVSQPMEP